MKTNYLIYILFIVSFYQGFSQQIERVEIDGKIRTEKGEELEGIHIYNISSQQGTVTNPQGKFIMAVAENDRLQVTSLQYAAFTAIVTEEVIVEGKMEIYLNPYINELSEVYLSNISLSGDLERDVENIPVFVVPEIDVSPEAIAAYDFKPDAQTRIKEIIAEDALGLNGSGNILKVDFVELAGSLFSKKKKTDRYKIRDIRAVYDVLKNRYSVEFFTDNFKIPEAQVDDFIYFVEDNLKDRSLLASENEMNLIAYLTTVSETYRKRM